MPTTAKPANRQLPTHDAPSPDLRDAEGVVAMIVQHSSLSEANSTVAVPRGADPPGGRIDEVQAIRLPLEDPPPSVERDVANEMPWVFSSAGDSTGSSAIHFEEPNYRVQHHLGTVAPVSNRYQPNGTYLQPQDATLAADTDPTAAMHSNGDRSSLQTESLPTKKKRRARRGAPTSITLPNGTCSKIGVVAGGVFLSLLVFGVGVSILVAIVQGRRRHGACSIDSVNLPCSIELLTTCFVAPCTTGDPSATNLASSATRTTRTPTSVPITAPPTLSPTRSPLSFPNCDGIRYNVAQLTDRNSDRVSPFQGSIPTCIGALTHLRTIESVNDDISGTIPTEIGRLTLLRRLRLPENALQGTMPTEFGLLTHLMRLDLVLNGLNGTIPTEIGEMTSMTQLFVSRNDFTGTLPTEIGLLTNLEGISIFNSGLSGRLPTELGRLTRLTLLRMQENGFTGPFPTELASLPLLRELDISENELRGTLPTMVWGNSTDSLQRLELHNNRLTGEIPALMPSRSLRLLSLQNNNMNGVLPDWMVNVTQFYYRPGNVNLTRAN